MSRCVISRRKLGTGAAVGLKSLLGTLVTVVKGAGNEDDWQYCFYNVRTDSNTITNIRVTSKTSLPEAYREGFSIGCGDVMNILELPVLAGIKFNRVEIIGSLAGSRRDRVFGQTPTVTSLVALLELYGLHIDSLLPMLEIIEDAWMRAHGQRFLFETCTRVEELWANKVAAYPRPNIGLRFRVAAAQAIERMVHRMLEQSIAGDKIYNNQLCNFISTFGQVGTGALRDILHPPANFLDNGFTRIIRRKRAELRLNLPHDEYINEPIPLREMLDPLRFLKAQRTRQSTTVGESAQHTKSAVHHFSQHSDVQPDTSPRESPTISVASTAAVSPEETPVLQPQLASSQATHTESSASEVSTALNDLTISTHIDKVTTRGVDESDL